MTRGLGAFNPERAKEARAGLHLSVSYVAGICNLPSEMIEQFESGELVPVADIICQLSEIYGVTVTYLTTKGSPNDPMAEMLAFQQAVSKMQNQPKQHTVLLVIEDRDKQDIVKNVIINDLERAFRFAQSIKRERTDADLRVEVWEDDRNTCVFGQVDYMNININPAEESQDVDIFIVMSTGTYRSVENVIVNNLIAAKKCAKRAKEDLREDIQIEHWNRGASTVLKDIDFDPVDELF